MNNVLKMVFEIIGILAGLTAIVIFVGNVEYIMASLSLTFGVLAIIWTVMAHSSLSPGSSLRSYTGYFLVCLIFIMMYSIWNSAVSIFGLTGMCIYIEYVFLTIAYLVIVSAAYKIYYLGKEFGFQKEADNIKKVMLKKTRKR